MSSLEQSRKRSLFPTFWARLGRLAARRPLLAVVATALSASLPALLFGFPNGHDTKLHLIWHTAFADQLWAGELYPRWLTEVMWGLGGPVFFYYPPMGFYASGLLSVLFPGDTLGRFALGATSAVALALSGGTAYLWLRTMAGAVAAAAGAVIYMLIPYHVAVDLYLRSAYAEYWAFVWMPLVLYCLARLPTAAVPATAGLALCYAALIATHLPTTLLFTPLAAAYALSLYARGRPRMLLAAAGGFALGAIAASAYLLPAILYQPYVTAQVFWQDFSYAFSPSEIARRLAGDGDAAVHGSISFVMLLHASFLYVLYLVRVCWFARNEGDAERRRQFTFWLVASAAIFFLVTPLSAVLWDLFPLFKKVQFAWRYHAVLCITVLPLCAFAIESAERLDTCRKKSVHQSIGVLIAGALLVVAGAAGNPLRFDRDEAAGRVALTSGVVELLPISAAATLQPADTFEASIAARYRKKWPRTVLADAEGRVEILDWRPRHIRLAVEAAETTRLIVGQLYFPGWRGVMDGDVPLAVSAAHGDPRLHLALPAGSHLIDLVLAEQTPERVGEAISTVTVSALLVILLAAAGRSLAGHRHRASTGQ